MQQLFSFSILKQIEWKQYDTSKNLNVSWKDGRIEKILMKDISAERIIIDHTFQARERYADSIKHSQ